ncbi:sensor domain-containing protein [Aerolutibacter ruishenii]|uniref:PAS domain S-box-containing protein/diguanylate cyclase (GGDEF)-like protein n=1 Tax=Aerolutibacter ruishenii TaxID=686800 RepID=A0A562LWY2_9GAMM|nr:sensor domain-containing diguanylate cyclase [Lysobacter ruishenii]TWI12028.1 PAS domain S-box-containing protein/diguanylate cyclase (GGDEF)-like protein [Lysobacter ruishenii]
MEYRLPPLSELKDLLLDALCVVDEQGRYLFVNAAYQRIFGYSAEEVLGRRMIDFVHPDDREATLCAARDIMAGHSKFNFQNRYLHRDGRVVHVQWSAHWSTAHRVRIALGHDITELKRAEAVQSALLEISEAAHAEADLQSLFTRIHRTVANLIPARNCFIALRQPEADRVEFPYFEDELDTAPDTLPLDAPTLSNHVIRSGEPLLITPETRPGLPDPLQPPVGHRATGWLGVPLATPCGVIGALVVQSYDPRTRYTKHDLQLLQFVSVQVAAAIERTRSRNWLAYLASHDPLTGLPNRSHFHQRLQQALNPPGFQRQPVALIYLDLDGFKGINDRFGHETGDQLLRAAGERIRHGVRQTDTIARLGGDEFAVLLHGTARLPDAMEVGETLRQALSRPFQLDSRRVAISASIGIALQPNGDICGDGLLQQADKAMYAAKRAGGDRLVLFDPTDAQQG